jgi:regulator of protease activity HflC (stomatin/prohibitin superfamily)
VPIGRGGVLEALRELDAELRAAGHPSLISDKRPHKYIGREVNPGSFGLYEFASGPKLLLQPGRYPGLPLANWVGCDWRGTYDLATNFPPLRNASGGVLVPEEDLQRLGLTIVQVAQNQAAVCLDPQMRVFVVRDRGFIAMATTGAYKVLGLVDMTHLTEAVVDRYSKQVLGHTQSVRLPNKYVAATFLDIPANNVAILQRKNDLFQLGAGQHFLTSAGVSLRGFFTMGEVQIELECDNIYTRDQVPVWLRLYLRYELQQPLQLAKHGYPTPFDALQDKARSILTQIVAHLDYSTMARTRNAAPEFHDGEDDAGAVFVSAVRTQAIDELKVIAREYGIKLEDLAIIDRKFKGEIAAKLDSLTTRALEAQVESANLDRENANKRLKQHGEARVLELQNEMKRATVETDNQNAIARARAKAESLTIEAQAEATAIKLRAEAQAEATRIQARVDADIRDEFARDLAQGRLEVERTRAYGNGTVFAPMEALRSGGMVGMGLFGPRPQPPPATPSPSGTVSRK